MRAHFDAWQLFAACPACAVALAGEPKLYRPSSLDLAAECYFCGQKCNPPPKSVWPASVEAEAEAYRARHSVRPSRDLPDPTRPDGVG
mgnify:CR=1 FL=1